MFCLHGSGSYFHRDQKQYMKIPILRITQSREYRKYLKQNENNLTYSQLRLPIRGGSTISGRRGPNSQRRGRRPSLLVEFFKKSYEIKGGGGSWGLTKHYNFCFTNLIKYHMRKGTCFCTFSFQDKIKTVFSHRWVPLKHEFFSGDDLQDCCSKINVNFTFNHLIFLLCSREFSVFNRSSKITFRLCRFLWWWCFSYGEYHQITLK